MSGQDRSDGVRDALPELGTLALVGVSMRRGARLADRDGLRPEDFDESPRDGKDVRILSHYCMLKRRAADALT